MTRANRARPTAPATKLTADGQRHNPRSCTSCRRVLAHMVDSSTNETTSTIAAAHANSHAGTGRLARPEMPCALALAGPRAPQAHMPAASTAARKRTDLTPGRGAGELTGSM